MARLAALVLAGVFATSADAAPPGKSETAASGDVRARIVYAVTSGKNVFTVRLSISRAGRVVFEERVPPYSRRSPGMWPAGAWSERRSILVKDLEKYVPIHHFWGDGAYRLADLDEDRLQEFVTADARFAYAFSSFAESSFPLQVWTYGSGRFIDTTRDHPDLIREDAAKQWRWRVVAHRKHWNELGVLAAWTADQCLLGRGDEAYARLRRLIAAGALGDDGWGSLAGYVPKLRTFLQRNGYSCRGKT